MLTFQEGCNFCGVNSFLLLYYLEENEALLQLVIASAPNVNWCNKKATQKPRWFHPQ